MNVKKILAVLLIIFLTSCTSLKFKPKEDIYLEQVSFEKLKGWHHDDLKTFWPSFVNSCNKFLVQPEDKELYVGNKYFIGSLREWHGICRHVVSATPHEYRKIIEDYFHVYKVRSSKKDYGLFTGYYEANLRAHHKRDKKYKYPIYKLPSDRKQGILYYSRKEIEDGALHKKDLELYWTDDKVELFFMHIQGSGRLHFPDGKIIRIGYAGQNGHPYTPIGAALRDLGAVPPNDSSADTIKRWLKHNPEKANQIMNLNKSYIFFREVDAKNGPIGSQTIELTPMRSVAIDRKFIPLGIPLWLETTLPTTFYGKEKPFNTMVMAQDTGGAIKGAIRLDFFFGHGKKAETLASGMKQKGRYYILVPRSVNIYTK